MTDGEIRSACVTLAQAMTTQAQAVSTQAQDMVAQANREIGPRVQQNANITASYLRDFTRMKPPMIYGSKVNEYPKYFIDEVYKILYAVGLTSNEKAELTSYQLKHVSNGKSGNSPSDKPTCAKCSKKHRGEFLVGTRNCFGCGKEGHKVRDCPNVRSKEKGSVKAQSSGSTFYSPKKNRFYDLHSRGEQEESPDVVTGMLQIFSIDVYALLDSRATLSFVTPLVAKRFDFLPDILIEPFSVTTSVGDSVVARRVFRSCPISLPNRVIGVDSIELVVVDFDVILEVEWFHTYFASIDCRTRAV
ncbi:uncharacterized protein [Solanum lycopersicum]|uniref:uncharacterized protein n=1 Tax=Solanum lycopersicum TaxID=4081 RepID=UPI00374A5769